MRFRIAGAITRRCARTCARICTVICAVLLLSCTVGQTATPVPTLAPRETAAGAGSSEARAALPIVASQGDAQTPTASPSSTAVPPTMAPETPTPAVEPAQLLFRAHDTVIRADDPTQIDMVLERLIDFYGVQMLLTFDATRVQVVDADPGLPGVQISPGALFANLGFVALNRVDNELGTVEFAATLVNPARPLTGETVAASLMLIATNPGEVRLDVAEALLASFEAQPIPVVSEALTVDAQP
jgi:hypothetical protein